jgi:hypothetical protein
MMLPADRTDDLSTEKAKMLRGELYWSFLPELVQEREACAHACRRLNPQAENISRREQIELIAQIIPSTKPLPPKLDDAKAEASQLSAYPWIEPPFRCDYGSQVRLGDNVYINCCCTIIDTCLVTIGSRTLIGPNVNFYTAIHPQDPEVRNGLKGPEMGKEIHIGEDVWVGGNVTVLPGVQVGNGAVLGAGSVVTKDVAPYTVVVGNPARFLKRIQCRAADEYYGNLGTGESSNAMQRGSLNSIST